MSNKTVQGSCFSKVTPCSSRVFWSSARGLFWPCASKKVSTWGAQTVYLYVSHLTHRRSKVTFQVLQIHWSNQWSCIWFQMAFNRYGRYLRSTGMKGLKGPFMRIFISSKFFTVLSIQNFIVIFWTQSVTLCNNESMTTTQVIHPWHKWHWFCWLCHFHIRSSIEVQRYSGFSKKKFL